MQQRLHLCQTLTMPSCAVRVDDPNSASALMVRLVGSRGINRADACRTSFLFAESLIADLPVEDCLSLETLKLRGLEVVLLAPASSCALEARSIDHCACCERTTRLGASSEQVVRDVEPQLGFRVFDKPTSES